MSYLAIKHSHMLLAIISVIFFCWRFYLCKSTPEKLANKLYKISPHIIDTLLLASGLTLAIMAGFKVSEQPWLAVKLVALVIYIGAGIVAIKKRSTPMLGICLLAILTIFYCARTKLA